MATGKKRELTGTERIFARGVAEGKTLAESYRIAVDRDEITAGMKVNASKMNKRPWVQEQVRRLRDGFQIHDLDSVGQAWSDLLNLLKAAEGSQNYSAAANLMRQRLTGLGALETRLRVTNAIDDNQLIDTLSGGDEAKRQTLLELLGADSFDSTTKH